MTADLRTLTVALSLAAYVPVSACVPKRDGEQAASPVTKAAGWTGLCLHVGKDLVVKEARVVASSGDVTVDERRRLDTIGMKTPVPVAWTRDFWSPVSISEPGTPTAGGQSVLDCSKFNLALCGQANCRQAPQRTGGLKTREG